MNLNCWIISLRLVPRGFGMLALVAVMAGAGVVASAAMQSQAIGASVLPTDALAGFTLPPGTAQRISVTGQPFTTALRLVTRQKPKFAWDLQITQRIQVPITRGDVLVATFYMRNIKAESGYGRTDLILENTTTYEKSVYYSAVAGWQWRKFTVPFVAVENEAAGGSQLNFHLGFNPQIIEIGGVSLVNYGKTRSIKDFPTTQLTYAGREPGAAWRKAAEARIEKYRKGDLTVRVADGLGKPVPHASVSVQMTRHAFWFGSEIDAHEFVQNTPEAQQYRDKICSLFNKVVFGVALKWPDWEGVGGGTDREDALQAIKILRAHHVAVRGHNLVWPSWVYLPPDLEKLKNDRAALRKRIDDHITEEVTTLRGLCREWDVVNEPYDNRTLIDIFGGDPIMVEWYNRAHDADPAAQLFLNDEGEMENGGDDTTRQQTYRSQIALLKARDHLGGIGFEGHFSQILTPPERLLALLNDYGKFGLPMQANEFDVDVSDPQLQADYIRDYMTAFFSHPQVQGIMLWGFWEGEIYMNANTALYRTDWTLKPYGRAWYDLVFHRWWTSSAGVTGARGAYHTRGFLGDYVITVRKGNHTAMIRTLLPRTGTVVTVRMP